jgi:UDP-glucuronate 4-epimerase
VKVFLTGIAGFIGSHLATRLLLRGDAVIGLDSFDDTLYPAALHARNLAAVAEAGHSHLTFIRGDLCDVTLIDRLFAEHGFDAVVHLGGLAGVRPSLSEPARYQRVNVEGTLTILEAARKTGVRRVVFASSSSVYGAHSPVPFSERDPAVRPASPYAATKRAGEMLCSNYVDLYGMGTTALRFFTVYGPRQRPEMAIHKFARLILDGRQVPFYGDGSSARDYTYIDDIIDGVTAALDRQRVGIHCVYNLGGSSTTTLARLIELLEARLGRRANLDRQPDQPGDVPITFADVSLAERELGYAPKVPIEIGLDRFCGWLKAERAAEISAAP